MTTGKQLPWQSKEKKTKTFQFQLETTNFCQQTLK